jgi:Ser/Thr protein kinase RdoA (MazF antagonist)
LPYKENIKISTDDLLTIIRKDFPEEAINDLSPLPNSFINPIFKITLTNSSSYILKINNPHWPQKQTRELYAMRLAASKTSLPIPRVVNSHDASDFFPFSYHIQEYVSGFDLRKAVIEYQMTGNEFLSVIKKIGHFLGELHNISFNLFGDFTIPLEKCSSFVVETREQFLWHNQFKTWPECFRAYCLDVLYWVDRSSFSSYRPKLREKIEKFMDEIHIPPYPCFVHSDIQPSNVIISNKKVVGIVDFEWAYAGSAYFDYLLTSTGFSTSLYPTFETSSLLSVLPEIDPQKIARSFLSGYVETSNIRLKRERKELADFVSLLYLIGSWNWYKQSSSSSEITLLEKRIRELLSLFLQ